MIKRKKAYDLDDIKYDLYNTRATRNDIDRISINNVEIMVYDDIGLCIPLTNEQLLEFAKKEEIVEMISPILLSLEVDDEIFMNKI